MMDSGLVTDKITSPIDNIPIELLLSIFDIFRYEYRILADQKTVKTVASVCWRWRPHNSTPTSPPKWP